MKERPILFSGEMVRAILEGRKTQTRRVMKTQPDDDWHPEVGICAYEQEDGEPGPDFFGAGDEHECYPCPYSAPGDRLWVRETWAKWFDDVIYRATPPKSEVIDFSKHAWRPSIHMPRWASRITLEITKVRVERLQEITCGGYRPPSDIVAEGCPTDIAGDAEKEIQYWTTLWDSINAMRGFGWLANPWVWVIEFTKGNRDDF